MAASDWAPQLVHKTCQIRITWTTSKEAMLIEWQYRWYMWKQLIANYSFQYLRVNGQKWDGAVIVSILTATFFMYWYNVTTAPNARKLASTQRQLANLCQRNRNFMCTFRQICPCICVFALCICMCTCISLLVCVCVFFSCTHPCTYLHLLDMRMPCMIVCVPNHFFVIRWVHKSVYSNVLMFL